MGYVSAFERHRIDTDGSGIRTLICLYGCTLRCKYCPNRFAIESEEDVQRLSRSADDLLYEVMVDDIYFRATGGGVTFGGGEPLMQAEFIKEFIEKAPRSWSFNVETSLAVPFKNIALIAPYIDRFFVDIKTLNPKKYNEYTEGNLKLAKKNLKKLKRLVGSEKIIVRIPTIPDLVDSALQDKEERKLKMLGFTHIDKFDYQVYYPWQRKR